MRRQPKPDRSRRTRDPVPAHIHERRPCPGGYPSRRGRITDRVSAKPLAPGLSDPDPARHCSGPRHEMGCGRHASPKLRAGALRHCGGDQPPPEPVCHSHGGEGVDITPTGTSTVQKRWGSQGARASFPFRRMNGDRTAGTFPAPDRRLSRRGACRRRRCSAPWRSTASLLRWTGSKTSPSTGGFFSPCAAGAGEVVIVAIDDEALERIGGDAPPREMMARIVRSLTTFHPERSRSISPSSNRRMRRRTRNSQGAQDGASFGRGDWRVRPGRSAERRNRSERFGVGAEPSSVLWPIEAMRDARKWGLPMSRPTLTGVPRYIPMIYETPDGVLPSFALAAASRALQTDPVLGPDRIEIAGQSRAMDLGYHMPLRFYGPAGKLQAHQRNPGPSLRPSIRRRCVTKSFRWRYRRRARRTLLRLRSIALRLARKFSRRRSAISWLATDWPGRPRPVGSTQPRQSRSLLLMIALMANRRRGDGPSSRKSGFCPLARGHLSCVRPRLLAERRRAPRVSAAADRRLRRGAVHPRTSCRDKDRRREIDAGQVSLAAPSRPPFERARFSGDACAPGRRGDVPGPVRVDRLGGRSDPNGRETFSARCRPWSRVRLPRMGAWSSPIWAMGFSRCSGCRSPEATTPRER